MTVASTTPMQPAPARRGAAVAVLAADSVARRRVAAALERAGKAVVAGAAGAKDLGADVVADIVVLAVDGGVRALVGEIGAVRERLPDARIVLLAKGLAGRDVRRCIDAGADGVAGADDLDRTLAPTVDAVRAGQLVVPRAFRAQTHQPVLSSREKQVLGMVVMGLSNGEIASRLFLAESTVKSHLSSGFAKLGVRSRNEAAALILDPETRLGPGILAISRVGQEPPRPPAPR
jgi:DNA-binding NarL/FixJ family response regulator